MQQGNKGHISSVTECVCCRQPTVTLPLRQCIRVLLTQTLFVCVYNVVHAPNSVRKCYLLFFESNH